MINKLLEKIIDFDGNENDVKDVDFNIDDNELSTVARRFTDWNYKDWSVDRYENLYMYVELNGEYNIISEITEKPLIDTSKYTLKQDRYYKNSEVPHFESPYFDIPFNNTDKYLVVCYHDKETYNFYSNIIDIKNGKIIFPLDYLKFVYEMNTYTDMLKHVIQIKRASDNAYTFFDANTFEICKPERWFKRIEQLTSVPKFMHTESLNNTETWIKSDDLSDWNTTGVTLSQVYLWKHHTTKVRIGNEFNIMDENGDKFLIDHNVPKCTSMDNKKIGKDWYATFVDTDGIKKLINIRGEIIIA